MMEKVMLDSETKTEMYVFTCEGESKGVVVMCTDIFGIEVEKTHHRAQQVANFGYTVVLPDCLNNEPLTVEQVHTDPNALPNWLSTHHPTGEFCQNTLQKATVYAQQKFNKTPQQTFMIGVCYGGKALLHYLSQTNTSNSVKGGAMIAHGSFMQPEDLTHVQIPVLMIWAGQDTHFKYSEFSEGFEKFKAKVQAEGKQVCGKEGNFKLVCMEEANHGFWVQSEKEDEIANKASYEMKQFLQTYA